MTLSQISSIYLLSLPQSIHTQFFSFFSNFNKLTESMASSSGSNSQCPRRKYDVFLSFRGEDTRNTFTGHLYEGLKNRGIHTFKDDIELEYGDWISKELLTAIEESQVALVVFSKNYATSGWCLDELVRIMGCNKKKNGQTVIPVFYGVDPSHVRYQSESFADAFAKHELRYKDDVEGMQKVKGWRAALREAANLSGCDTRNRIESECIRDLVDQISKLCKPSLSYLKDIVGINTHLEEVKSLLQMEINDVRIVGIWGMGGVGKTTIADAIFRNFSCHFEAACFLADIKENKDGMHSLQNILLSELLGTKYDKVNNKYDGKHKIQSRLHSMKVLIVLDDIYERDHLEYLADDADWFGYGSRVVVTTRSRDLIMNANAIYEVTPLPDLEAMQLFNQYAFRKEDPDERFKQLSLEVVNHAKGLPLALKLWGSSLHKRDLTRWEITVDQIKKTPNSDVIQKLKISYNGLKSEEQEIFLDMACFFRGKEKKEVMQILESCGFGAKYGLDILIDKALVFIDPNYDTIQMHDLIQDMGKYIVNMQKNPGERSRLWDAEEIKDVMINNTGTEAVEAIWHYHRYYNHSFPFSSPLPGICFSKEAMKNMKMLRILHIYKGSTCDDGVIEYLSNNLCWFDWHFYPWKSLPPKFEPKKLVHLKLRFSKLCQLWKETKHFPCLRYLNLSWSSLMRTPDFREMPNLEHLYLSYCTNLEEVDDSLGYCGKLIQLDLSGCSNLKRFPCVNLESLKYLCLWGCSSLEKFPDIKGKSKLGLQIEMSACKVRELPSSFFQYQTHLTRLDLSNMKNLVSLPSSVGMLKSLVELKVDGCSKLESLPKEIGGLESLVKLRVYGLSKLKSFPEEIGGLESLVELNVYCCSELESLPEEIGDLKNLEWLRVSGCSKLKSLPEEIADLENLERLDAHSTPISRPPSSIFRLNKLKYLNFKKRVYQVGFFDRVNLVFPQVNEGLHSLEQLYLSDCNMKDGELPEDIGSLSSLKELYLNENNFENLPRSIAQLGALRILDVSHCPNLKEFPQVNEGLHSLKRLYLNDCNMKDGGLPEDIGSLSCLKELCLSRNNFENLPRSIAQLGALRILDVSHCPNLKEFPQVNDGLCSLEELDLSYCNLRDGGLPEDIGSLSSLEELRLSQNNFEHLPQSIAQLGALRLLYLSHCPNLKEFPQVNDGLRSLEKLDLSYCNLIDRGLPEDIGSLSSLKELYLNGNNFEHLPRSITQLAAIRSLHLLDCKRLKELPSFMGMPNLEYLNLGNCSDLEEVPCVNVESLKFLNLQDCSSLEKFPEIRGIMKLELKIQMEDSGIRELPSSYFQSTSYFQSKANFTMINFSFMKHLVALPSSIGMLKSLKELNVPCFSSLKILPEEIGDLENLEKLDASCTLISRPPSSIVHLNKLKSLSFKKKKSEVGLQDGVCFVFPSVNGGLRSLERLYLSYCNLKDGGLPEDIGSLSSLKELYLNGNNFENLPRSIAKLGALRILDVSDCMKLTQLPEFPQQLETIDADWSNDWICNSLFRNISSLQHDISASESLSLRVFTSGGKNIPSWFHHQGIDRSVSVNLPENWYVSDNFLGFAICYSGSFIETAAQLLPLCDDGISCMTQKLAISKHSIFFSPTIHFFLVPLGGFWDTSKANGKTPNDYGLIRLYFSREPKKFGLRLLYKDEPKLGKR